MNVWITYMTKWWNPSSATNLIWEYVILCGMVDGTSCTLPCNLLEYKHHTYGHRANYIRYSTCPPAEKYGHHHVHKFKQHDFKLILTDSDWLFLANITYLI